MTAADKQPLWLITGASGFVGRCLLEEINQRDLPVTTRSLQRAGSPAASTTQQAAGDLLDPPSLAMACAGVTTIIHLAGVAHVTGAAAAQAAAVNRSGALALLQAAITAGVDRFVYLSTVLADDSDGRRTAYGCDKAAVETALLEAASNQTIDVVILRAANIYGSGMRGNLAAMIRLMRAGRLPRLPRLSSELSLIHVRDVARALLAAAELQSATKERLAKRVTLTDGQHYSINAVQDAIYTALERRPSRLRLPVVILFAAAASAEILRKFGLYRGGIGLHTARNLTRHAVFDNAEALQQLSWQPSTTFYTELPALIEAMVKKR